MAPNPAHAPIAAMATPPLRCPSQVLAARKSDCDMPPRPANWPMSRNSGMMESEWLEKVE